jgi:hypothetical protein
VAIVTVLEEVIDTTIYGLTPVVRVLVLEDLHNEIQKDTLTIQGGYGANCKEKVHYLFNVGDTLIIGVDIDDGVAQLGFCVRQWLRLIDDQVIGRIAPNASTMTLDDFRGNLEACIGMTYSFDVSIFPNPASDVVSVTIENQDLLTHSVYVVSSDGRILRSIEDTYESSLSFSISNLSSGIYFVQATNSEGTFTSLKFIKP